MFANRVNRKGVPLEENPLAITSFVVRFVHSGPPENAAYRGSILNVQTNEEFSFRWWEEAVAFIARYVQLPTGDEIDQQPAE
jgi:hypothetical protein